MKRRKILKQLAQGSALFSGAAFLNPSSFGKEIIRSAAKGLSTPSFPISLQAYSLHKMIRGEVTGMEPLDHLELPRVAAELGFDAVDLSNSVFPEKQKKNPSLEYFEQIAKKSKECGVQVQVMMVGGVGDLGDPDPKRRELAIQRHKPFIDGAALLGAHSIRANARSKGTPDEQTKLLVEGTRELLKYADQKKVDVIFENHGHQSSDGEWLAEVIAQVDHSRCGALPDFGNFVIDRKTKEKADPYAGVKALMPYARCVSAKSYDFKEDGITTVDPRFDLEIDYYKMMKIVLDSGYKGYVGIEYEGNVLGEKEGIAKTLELLRASEKHYRKA